MLGLLAFMSLSLGASSYACGLLPLSFTFSKSYLDRLSALGTGLLLGAALGVIIPEGIEAVARPNTPTFPTSKIALSLLFGFTFMLVIEQLILPYSHAAHGDLGLHGARVTTREAPSHIEFDAELGDLEHNEGPPAGYSQSDVQAHSLPSESAGSVARAFPLTFGLFVHGLTDGLALGVSFLTTDAPGGGSSKLSFIVFLALLIHKAPTSFALTTSLMATSLPRAKCRKHLAAFSTSTPIGAIASYLLFSFLGSNDTAWTGIALLVSGGTFLYVATVLQPVSDPNAAGEVRPATRVLFIALGMFVPFVMSAVLGHGH